MKSLEKLSRAQFQNVSKLTQKKYRNEQRKFLVEGVHLVEEGLASDWEVEMVLVNEVFKEKKEYDSILRAVRSRGVRLLEVTVKELEKLSDTVTTQGVVGVVKQKAESPDDFWKNQGKRSLLVALENIADPGNVGTILRTCDWFGVDAVFMGGESVEIYNPKVVRSTMGAIFHLPVFTGISFENVLNIAKEKGYRIAATALEGGETIQPSLLIEKQIFIFGNEAHGVSREVINLAHNVVTIPRFGKGESLNVAVACGILLGAYRFTRAL